MKSTNYKKRTCHFLEHQIKWLKLKKYLDKLVTHKPVLEVSNFEDFNKLNLDCPNFKEVSKFYKR